MNKLKGFSAMFVPAGTVLLASACVMALELVAGRLVARHLGSSLYTWTSVIGVVLAGITIGYYIGGRIADRWEARKSLAMLFAISSAACVLVIVFNNTVSEWVFLWYLSWPARVLSHVSIIFLIPSVLLGAVSPVAAKMALAQGLPAGRTVGDIYAWGAAGSIAGTFLAGFYLIAAMGTIAIIWTVGAVLLMMAIFFGKHLRWVYVCAALYACALFMGVLPMGWYRTAGAAIWLREKYNPKVIYEDETPYCYVRVERISEKEDKRSFVQDRLLHSSIVMSNPTLLQYPYEQIMAAVTHRFGKDKTTPSFLIIGGGGYVLPRYLEKFWPQGTVDVAEIDPGVTEAAIKAFGLSPTAKINTISLDARNYVDEAIRQGDKKYDFIYEDALNDYSVPYQLTTLEFNEKLAQLLTDDGIYMVELIDIFDKALFLGAFINTLEQTFPFVSVISTRGTGYHDRNTFVVTAAKHRLNLADVCAGHYTSQPIWYFSDSDISAVRAKANGMILTDDYAPVDNLLAAVAAKNSQEIIANRYMKRADKYQRQGQLDKAMAEYRKVLKIDPGLSIKAYNNMAIIQTEQGKAAEAAENLKKALELNEKTGIRQNLAVIELNLGMTLSQLNSPKESTFYLQQAIEGLREILAQEPNTAWVWSYLGEAMLEMDDFNEASKAFDVAIKLEPGNPSHYRSLAVALESQNRYDDANRELSKGYRFMREHNLTGEASELQEFIEMSESRRRSLKNKPLYKGFRMPDKRTHRGPHPADGKLFSEKAIPDLRAAAADYSLLLTKGYGEKGTLKLVGDKFSLTERQRIAVMRGACSDRQLESRKVKEMKIEQLRGQELALDGYNVLITIEAAMSGGIIFKGRDGCFRDLASIHGTYRKVTETIPALELIGKFLKESQINKCLWLLDSPVSNSGRLKTLIRELAEKNGWDWEIKLTISPDAELIKGGLPAATSDSVILDGCKMWVNLARTIIETKLPQVWMADLS